MKDELAKVLTHCRQLLQFYIKPICYNKFFH